MEKIQYETAGYITQTVRLNHLKNIIIETGTENAFYPEENRFVLSKDNSFVIYNLLYECKELESVDFTNFDFTETVSRVVCQLSQLKIYYFSKECSL